MSFTRVRFIGLQARAASMRAIAGTRSFSTTGRIAGPRSLATPFASTVSSQKPSAQQLSDHYNKFLDVYENDGSLVSTHNLSSRTVTHYPIEEVLEAPVNVKAESADVASMKTSAAAPSSSSYNTENNVYYVDGREAKLTFA